MVAGVEGQLDILKQLGQLLCKALPIGTLRVRHADVVAKGELNGDEGNHDKHKGSNDNREHENESMSNHEERC